MGSPHVIRHWTAVSILWGEELQRHKPCFVRRNIGLLRVERVVCSNGSCEPRRGAEQGNCFECKRIMRDQEQEPIARPEPDLHMPDEHVPAKGDTRPRSLEDPEAYQDFVESLFAKIKPRIRCKLDDETQIEIAGLTRLLTTMPRKAVEENRVYFETAFDLLADEEPNLLLIRSFRFDLGSIEGKYAGGLSRIITSICGRSALSSVMSALCTIFVLSFIVVLALSATHGLVNTHAANFKEEFPLFFAIKNVPIGDYLLTIHAAFFGSIVSVIVRVRAFLNSTEFNPLLIYFSVLTKPFIAAMFAVLAFSVMKAGLVSFLGVDLSGPSTPYIAWAVGFLCGFSERIAQDFVSRTGGALGDSPELRPKQ